MALFLCCQAQSDILAFLRGMNMDICACVWATRAGVCMPVYMCACRVYLCVCEWGSSRWASGKRLEACWVIWVFAGTRHSPHRALRDRGLPFPRQGRPGDLAKGPELTYVLGGIWRASHRDAGVSLDAGRDGDRPCQEPCCGRGGGHFSGAGQPLIW